MHRQIPYKADGEGVFPGQLLYHWRLFNALLTFRRGKQDCSKEDTVIIKKVFQFYRKLVTKPEYETGEPAASVAADSSRVVNSNAAIEQSRDKCKELSHAIPRDEHNISRRQLSPNALKVLYRLQDNGYEAYLVGGCIRDILLGLEPKDFDVATNATPEQIKACFNNCRLIGRRFRLAHIMYGREVIEVATFRGHHAQPAAEQNNKHNDSHHSNEGQLLRDNVYGSIEEDAQRRDFTINALYYSVNGFYLRDFVGGLEAIKARKIELIGDPEGRYREDPVRMLRAVRFSTKLDMEIATETAAPIHELASLLGNIPPARLFEESMKMTMAGKAEANYLMMREYDLFRQMFPVPTELLDGNPDSRQERLVRQMFVNTDTRINSGKRVTPAYVHAALLWYVVEKETEKLRKEKKLSHYDAAYLAQTEVLNRHCKSIALPKRFSTVSRDIWQLQYRLSRRGGKRAFKLMEHPKFRAGFDFLLLRGEIEGGEVAELGQWWQAFQQGDEGARQRMADSTEGGGGRRRNADGKPRRRRTRRSNKGNDSQSTSTGKNP